ncbi:MAG TPA: class I SAM-dependent methyltransferase [Actinomycetota bacterium]|nr:class I SAM-dependent methyltransferase [Actinomycetota bacterium]
MRRRKKETKTPIADAVHPTAARGFNDGVVYEQGRPSYPPEAVTALNISPPHTVVDLGCGTGKFTRLLTPTGARIIGIEPLAIMNEMFRTTCPNVTLLTGVAERLPLRACAVDLITCASAFHWFDHERALPELHRVLRTAGRLAIIWNRRDKLAGWPAEFFAITEQYRGDTPGYRSNAWRDAIDGSALFGPIEERWFDNVQHADLDGLLARVESISFIETLPASEKAAVIARAREFLVTHPDTRGREHFELPYHTALYVTRRLN